MSRMVVLMMVGERLEVVMVHARVSRRRGGQAKGRVGRVLAINSGHHY